MSRLGSLVVCFLMRLGITSSRDRGEGSYAGVCMCDQEGKLLKLPKDLNMPGLETVSNGRNHLLASCLRATTTTTTTTTITAPTVYGALYTTLVIFVAGLVWFSYSPARETIYDIDHQTGHLNVLFSSQDSLQRQLLSPYIHSVHPVHSTRQRYAQNPPSASRIPTRARHLSLCASAAVPLRAQEGVE